MENNTILGHFSNTTEEPATVTTYNCKVYRFIMSVGITGSLCCFGIVGNILTLLVFSKFNQNSSDRKSRSSAPLLLSGLALSDSLLLLTLFIVKSLPSLISFTNIYPEFFTSYLFSFLMIYGWNTVDVAQCINTWITVLVTLHRFIAIVSPHKAIIHCTYCKAKIHLIIISILVLIYEIPIFLDSEIKSLTINNNQTIYVPVQKDLSHWNHWYMLMYGTIFYYIIMYLVPWILLAIMTIFLIKTVKKAQEFRSQSASQGNYHDNTDDITRSLLAVVVTSLVCRPWEPVRRLIETTLGGQPGCGHYYFYYEEFPSLTSALNSSANFTLYCLFCKRFPQTLKEIFGRRKSNQLENSQTMNTAMSTISVNI